MRFWTLSPSAFFMIVSRGSRKVLPIRTSGLNSGKDLLEVGPPSCLDFMETVGITGLSGVPSSRREVGVPWFWDEADDFPPLQLNKPLIWHGCCTNICRRSWMFQGFQVRLMIFLPSSCNKPLIRILESPGPDSTW